MIVFDESFIQPELRPAFDAWLADAIREAEAAAYERAAKVASDMVGWSRPDVAEAIRALAAPPEPPPGK